MIDHAIERRAMLQQMALLLGAAALPADALAQGVRGGRRFLNRARLATLSAVADTIMPATDTPGAVAVGVPAKIDAMLRNWASPATRMALVGALATIEGRAMAVHQLGFAALTPDQRKALLLAYEPEALRAVPRARPLSAIAALLAGPSVVDNGYARLKGLVISTYYLSEIAMTQELIYEHVPGSYTPSIPVTPEMRPWAVGGLFS